MWFRYQVIEKNSCNLEQKHQHEVCIPHDRLHGIASEKYLHLSVFLVNASYIVE